MNRRTAPFHLTPMLLGAAVLLGACSELESPTDARSTGPSLHILPAQSPQIEYVVLCKAGPVGTYTFHATATSPILLDESTGLTNLTAADYTITITPGSVVTGTTIPGACYTSGLDSDPFYPAPHNHIASGGGSVDDTVTVVETGMPAGLVFEKADVYRTTKTQSNNTTTVTTTTTTTNSVAARVGGDGLPSGSRTLWGSGIIFYDVAASGLSVSKTAAGTYDIPVSWQLAKSVTPTSHTGTAGQTAGTSTWTVTATRVNGSPTNHVVSGNITVSNPAGGATRTFTVVDTLDTAPKTAATVTCPKYSINPGEDVVCTYSVAAVGATLNTATVSVDGLPDVSATAAVAYTLDNYAGDESVTLADPRLGVSQLISSTTTLNIPETFACPAASASYVNGTYTRTEPNTATLTGANTSLSRSAQVTITCTIPPVVGDGGGEETATGAGMPWSATQGAPNNWFMYTPWATTGNYRGISAAASGSTPAGTDLIAGRTMVAGRITGTRSGSTTSITITLNSTFKFGASSDNVKIIPMSCTTAQKYVQPGKFTIKRTASAAASSITVTGLSNTACYGIHASVVAR